MQRIKITTIKPDGYAERIGLRADDVLDTLNGAPLQMPDDLTNQLGACSDTPGELWIFRKGERIRYEITSPTLGVIVATSDVQDLLAQQERAKRASEMIVTTAPSVEGYRVVETLDVVSAECVFGVNVLKEFVASITDTLGGRSETLQDILRNGRKECLSELRQEAADAGANAVIMTNLSYNEFTGSGKSMLLAVATGTAVRIEKI